MKSHNCELKKFQVIFIALCHLTQILSHPPQEQACRTDGQVGFCISLKSQIKYCPKLHSWLQSGNESDWEKLRQTFCAKNITEDHTRVCCPLDSYVETPSTNDPSFVEPIYSQHPNFKLLPHDLKCGNPYSSSGSRIIGGEKAKVGDFPWMSRISLSQGPQGKNKPFFGCSGTIINKRYILTAAHCLYPVVRGAYNFHWRIVSKLLSSCNAIRSVIRLAETDENVNPESITLDDYVLATSPYLDYEHEEFIVHPNYTGSSSSLHDIALIRLNKDINVTSDFTKPVCLPFVKEFNLEGSLSDDKILRQNATVCGWGKTNSFKNEGSSVLQYVMVPIQSNILCRIVYQHSNSVSDFQICAGGRKGRSSCAGDSGGPLTKVDNPADPKTKIKAARHFQIGIVSFGKSKCAGANEPAIYTRVRNYLTWILDTIRE